MATPAQLIAAIIHGNTMELNLAATPYNQVTVLDVENYVALGLVAGTDTAESLLKIVSPINTPVYENAGFLTDDYSAPDFEFLASPVDSITKDLPHVTGGTAAIAGNYTVYVKQKVVAGGITTYVTKTLSFTVCVELMKTAELTPTYNCDGSPATFTVTDNTNLAGKDGFVFSSVARTIEIAPPFGSGLSPVTGSSSPFTQNPLWTGTYGFSVEGFITFVNGNDTIIVRYAINGEKLVICNDILCKMYCCLKKLRTAYYDEANASQKEILFTRWQLGMFEYGLAARARMCGDSEANLSGFIDKFYVVTKCDPNCDCCDDTDAVAPVISDCGCTPGENGKQVEFQMNGTWVQWRYVGDLGWNNLYDTSGSIGPAGINGINGSSLIFSGPVVSGVIESVFTNTNGVYETLSAFSTDHTNQGKTLLQVGDIIRLHAIYKMTANPNLGGINVQLLIDGTGLANITLATTGVFNAGNAQIEVFCDITLKSATAGANTLRIDSKMKIWNLAGVGLLTWFGERGQVITDIGGATVDFANRDYVISAQGFSDTDGDLSLQEFTAEKITVGVGVPTIVGIQYMTPFTTTNAVQDYPNVLGGIGKTILRVYLDGQLLTSADWSYDSLTDTLSFVIAITGASEVAADYSN